MINTDLVTRYFYKLFPLRFMRYHAYRVDRAMDSCASIYNKQGNTVLDVGAGSLPYAGKFDQARYQTQDIVQNQAGTIDFVCDITQSRSIIPDERADVIICCQVFEHLSEPSLALEEMRRILRPGGRIYLTTHMAFEEHMVPHDYFRFTEFGIRHLASKAQMEVVSFEKHGGTAQLIHYLLWTWPIRAFWPHRSGAGYYIYSALITPVTLVSGALANLLDIIERDSNIYVNFEVVLEK